MTRAHARVEARQLVVMIPSDPGKSIVGRLLATRLGIPFIDADDLHSSESIRKGSTGTAFGDEDRWSGLALKPLAADERGCASGHSTPAVIAKQIAVAQSRLNGAVVRH